jgi:hypothetical protein
MAQYCTLHDVKDALNITDETRDDGIQRLILAASAELDNYCDRSFASTSATKYYDGVSDDLLIDDLISVTSIKADPGGDGTYETTFAATDYILYPYQGPPYWKVRLSENSAQSDLNKGVRKGIQIVGSWGYQATVPEPVKQACLEMVCRAYRQEQAGYGTTVGIPDVGMGQVFQGLSSDIKRKLDRYVRHEYA